MKQIQKYGKGYSSAIYTFAQSNSLLHDADHSEDDFSDDIY